jgi:NAD(P)-dependent dehydrogenase (short-subunit alcohol dehydrogenase family)
MEAIQLDGDVAVVTGASRGLGRGMALALARAGAHVVAVARDEERLRDTVSEIMSAGGHADLVTCDVTDENSVAAMAHTVHERHGRVDVVINNAGIAWERWVTDLSVEEFRQTLEVNVTGTFLVTQALGRRMIDAGHGRVVNIGSIDAVVGAPALTHYCASKGAVVQFTRALAAEWARHGIVVNCLCPGYFPTDINRQRLEESDIREKVLRRIPMRRFGQLEELMPWVLMLASRTNSYMTGQVVLVDGGESAR